MNHVWLSDDEVNRAFESKRREVGELKGRLQRAWTSTCYLNSEHVVRLTGKQIDDAITHMKGLISYDQPSGAEDCDFHYQYDHEAIEERIKEFEELKKQQFFNPHVGARVPVYSYAFWYVVTGYDDRTARNQVHHFEELRKIVLREGEPVPPTGWFSGPGDKKWMP